MSTHAESTAIARRYASAAFDLAQEQGVVSKVVQDLNDLYAYVKENHELRHLLFDRSFGLDVQKKVFTQVLEKAKFHDISIRFSLILLENGRIIDLREILRVFEKIRFNKGERVLARVRSALPLTKKQHDAIVEALKDKLSGEITVEVSQDPSLIAGVVVEVGNTLIDSTIKTKIDRLALSMKGT